MSNDSNNTNIHRNSRQMDIARAAKVALGELSPLNMGGFDNTSKVATSIGIDAGLVVDSSKKSNTVINNSSNSNKKTTSLKRGLHNIKKIYPSGAAAAHAAAASAVSMLPPIPDFLVKNTGTVGGNCGNSIARVKTNPSSIANAVKINRPSSKAGGAANSKNKTSGMSLLPSVSRVGVYEANQTSDNNDDDGDDDGDDDEDVDCR
mmetsp:Transcript_1831/g.2208  ORF Transcript_1831/g.2208 Transcript_1831/m.2208 type:complete len:205 (-) Transcript_1831:19-633(-)